MVLCFASARLFFLSSFFFFFFGYIKWFYDDQSGDNVLYWYTLMHML